MHDDVYATFARDKSGGPAGRDRIAARNEACREKLGKLWGVAPIRVAFTPSASEGMSGFARGLDWRAGDNVVTDGIDTDFAYLDLTVDTESHLEQCRDEVLDFIVTATR